MRSDPRQRPGAASWTKVDGLRIAYEAWGRGPALLLAHGWSGDRSHWHRQRDAFDAFRVVALDLPGHGQSDKPEAAYPIGLFAAAVEAVLDAEGVARAALVGHSNGVPIVREVYRRARERVTALVGVDGWLRNPIAPEALEWMRRMADSPEYESMMRQMVERTPFGSLAPDDVDRIKRGSLATPAHVHRAGVDMMADPAVWEPDPIDAPLLLIHGASPQLTPDYEDFVRALAPQVELEVWEGVGHFIPMERPERLNARIQEFLAPLIGS